MERGARRGKWREGVRRGEGRGCEEGKSGEGGDRGVTGEWRVVWGREWRGERKGASVIHNILPVKIHHPPPPFLSRYQRNCHGKCIS